MFRRFRRVYLSIFFGSLCISGTFALLFGPRSEVRAAQEIETAGCTDCDWTPEDTELRMFGAYYNVRRFDASLILNNKRAETLPVELTIFSSHGERLDLPLIELPGSSAETLDLNQVLAGQPQSFQEGNIELRYRNSGCALVLSAGIILEDPSAGIAFDELLTRQHHLVSNRLESVWWVPSSQSRVELAVSNMTNAAVSATIDIHSEGATGRSRSRTVSLAPHETRLINIPRVFSINLFGDQPWQVGSISIRHSGEVGALVARGMVEDRATGFSNVIEFSDPASGGGTSLQGTGLRFQSLEGEFLLPVVVVRNLAETASEVNLRIPYIESGAEEMIELDPIILGPGEIRDLTPDIFSYVLSLPVAEISSAGMEGSFSTEPGSVLIAAFSTDLSGSKVFRVPLVDPQRKGSSGNYPWRISGNSSTFFHVKNAGDAPQYYKAQIDFPGGAYVYGPELLPPGQAAVVDIRKLRNEQEPDDLGVTIPLSASSGQIHWSVVGPNASNHTLIGRSEQVDNRGFSSTFACDLCCPDSYDYAWVSPIGGDDLPEGLASLFKGWQRDIDCTGMVLNPYLVPWGYWVSSNQSVADVDGDGLVTGISPGEASITASWTGVRYQYHSAGVCMEYYYNAGGLQNATIYKVVIDSADITQGNDGEISVDFLTQGIGLELNFTLQLYSPGSGYHTIISNQPVMEHSGDPAITYPFHVDNIPLGEYTQIKATWGSASYDFPYHFMALGDYSNTRYNIPDETGNQCVGSGLSADFKSTGPGDCINIPNCDKESQTGMSTWLDEIWQNGSGYHSTLGFVTREWYCTESGVKLLRDLTINWGCPRCSAFSLDTNQTVAINPGHNYLDCGNRVYVHGVGVRTVTDWGSRVGLTQLDHFSGKTDCDAVYNIGTRKVFKLY